MTHHDCDRGCRILLISNEGAGFAEWCTIIPGETIAELFARKFCGSRSEDFFITVNREIVAGDTPLKDGDRVVVTPRKIEGA